MMGIIGKGWCFYAPQEKKEGAAFPPPLLWVRLNQAAIRRSSLIQFFPDLPRKLLGKTYFCWRLACAYCHA